MPTPRRKPKSSGGSLTNEVENLRNALIEARNDLLDIEDELHIIREERLDAIERWNSLCEVLQAWTDFLYPAGRNLAVQKLRVPVGSSAGFPSFLRISRSPSGFVVGFVCKNESTGHNDRYEFPGTDENGPKRPDEQGGGWVGLRD